MEEFIKKCQEAYEQGRSIISDAQYDYLVSIHPDSEKVIGKRGDTPHYKRMYSLQKYYIGKDEIPDTTGYVKTPKLDGCAVSLLYVDNKFTLALTRGDGVLGNDITEKMRSLVPATLPSVAFNIRFITGEVINTVIQPNGRNLVAGALNCKENFQERADALGLIFVAYDEPISTKDYSNKLTLLKVQGFKTVLDKDLPELTTDGVVYRLGNGKQFESLGYTDKFPRGAFALKEIQEGVVTTLLDVEWQTGGSGKITPVAILEPVDIEGAIVARATLNNIAYIEALGLEVGCQVRVIRSGEIIPKIVERVD